MTPHERSNVDEFSAFRHDFVQHVTNNAYTMADEQLPEPLRSLAGLAAGPVMMGAELADRVIARLDNVKRDTPVGKVLAATLDRMRHAIDSLQGGSAFDLDNE